MDSVVWLVSTSTSFTRSTNSTADASVVCSKDIEGVIVIVFTEEGVVSGATVVISGSVVVPMSVISRDVTVVRLVNGTVTPVGSVTLSVTCSETI